jgi:hypothetical protein
VSSQFSILGDESSRFVSKIGTCVPNSIVSHVNTKILRFFCHLLVLTMLM